MKLPPMPSVAAIDVSGERVGDCPESKPNLTMNFEQSMLEIAATIALNVVFDRHHSFSTLRVISNIGLTDDMNSLLLLLLLLILLLSLLLLRSSF